MVMTCQVVSAGACHGGEAVVGERVAEDAACRAAGAQEMIVCGILHFIRRECSPQAAFVERAVVGYERQPFEVWLYFVPYDGEGAGQVCIAACQAMNACIYAAVEVGVWAYEAVQAFGDFAFAHDDDADAANACAVIVGGFEIDGCEVFHTFVVWLSLAAFHRKNSVFIRSAYYLVLR